MPLRNSLLALAILVSTIWSAATPVASRAASYGPVATITVPPVTPGAASGGFGMAALDVDTQRYFVADRANRSVDIVDAISRAYLGRITGFATPPAGAVSGPNALVLVPSLNEMWATDSDGTVKVISVPTTSVVDVIPTGATKRADQIAYNPDANVILATNDQEAPPSATVISVATRTVLGQIQFPNATKGLGQVVYDRVGQAFLVAVPASTANPGGEIDTIDLTGLRIRLAFPLNNCAPNALSMGPAQRFIVGCANQSGLLTTQLMNAKSGQVIAVIPQVGGIGGVTYSPITNTYYVAAVDMTTTGIAGGPPRPVLGIISGDTNTWIGNVPLPALISRPEQAITVNPATEDIYLPLEDGTIKVTRNVGGVGGDAFAMTVAAGSRLIVLTWEAGTAQSGYSLVRVGGTSGVTVTPIAANATTFADRVPDTDRVVCYQLVVNVLSGPPGLSDVLCAMPGLATGQHPISFGIQLNQSPLASVYWTIGPAPNSFIFAPLGTARVQPIRNGIVAIVDNTDGAATCYALISITGADPTGVTDIVCGIPGHANLPGTTGSAAEATATSADRLAAMTAVTEALEHRVAY